MKTSIRERLKQGRLYCDGGMGTLLQARGLRAGEQPELWNLTRPDDIRAIHAEYLAAGSDVITANTFGASALKFDNVTEIVTEGIRLAREAVEACGREAYVAYDIGPLGRLLKPLGDLAFEDAVNLFAEGVRAAAEADVILIETMNDAYETKAAVLAAKENSDLPIFVTNAYDGSGKLMTGADPRAMVALLEGLRVDALGINCSLGPEQMLPVVETLLEYSSVPVIVNPNAGLPVSVDGKTTFTVDAEAFSDIMVRMAEMGVSLLGGCCGTTPEYIRKTVEKTKGISWCAPTPKSHTLVSSYTHAVEIGREPVLIGERINPTGKARFKTALREGDLDYIINEGLREEEQGAHILDVNVGLPEIDEAAMMHRVMTELQAVTDLPLQIDTPDGQAMELALREYNGKAMINSVNGKEESLRTVLPLAAKYGGVVVALTLDESGIPATAEGRYAIAERIVSVAEGEYGIDRRDIVVDPLAMTISSDNNSAVVTLEAIRLIKERLGVRTSLGVSNISFGLPRRDIVTSSFFSMALVVGLDCAIMNPHSVEMMKVYHAYRALRGMDENCMNYIAFASGLSEETAVQTAAPVKATEGGDPLFRAIVKGLREAAHAESEQQLKHKAPLDIINDSIVPALDEVGRGFEKNTVYLPQLLMSAEAAKAAFESIRLAMGEHKAEGDRRIVLATVKGDIHDIGKNIVKVLLENYGFTVLDLGKDVAPETVCNAVVSSNARLVGLSALMTTTVPAMADTIRLLRERAPEVRVMVGGAVMTEDYANQIGADFYAKDAMQGVRVAEAFFKDL